jgi:hypothetical protein
MAESKDISHQKVTESKAIVISKVECHICKKIFTCSCVTKHSGDKLSCTNEDKYPQSKVMIIDKRVIYLHLCSKDCAEQMNGQIKGFDDILENEW